MAEENFSLSLLTNEISNNLDDVRALATRVSIDNELKYYLGYSSANLTSYYDSFENMIQSNPAYSVIDRFIVADSSYSHFLQTGGTTLSYGQPLRSDYFLQEIAHIEEESSYSGIFFSDLAYRSYQVIGYMMPIIDFNNGLTIGYVYASVNIDALLKNLYSYQELNNEDLFIRFSGTNYEIKDGALYATSSQPKLEIEPILRNETSKVFKSNTGRYILSIENEKNNFAVNDFREQWIDFPEFLSYLPTLRSQSYDPVLASTAVQEMRDSHSRYYFQIEAVMREGEPIPLERLSGTIRRILFNQRKGEIIRNHEEELYRRATEEGEVKLFEEHREHREHGNGAPAGE